MTRLTVALGAGGLLSSVLLAVGCGSSSPASSGAAEIVPAGTLAYIAVDTDPGSAQWRAVNKLADRFPGKQKGIDEVKRSVKESGIDYETDVKPALGAELDVAWLDFDHNGEDVVVLLQPRDEGAFKRLVAKGNAKDRANKVVYERVGAWEVLAAKQSILDRFSSESRGSDAMLAGDPSFERAMKSISSDSLLRAYVNGGKAMAEIRKQGGVQVGKVLDKVGKLDWIAAGVGASGDGVRFDTVVRGTPGKILQGNGGETLFHAALPESVPGNALLYFAFHGSKGMFDSLGKVPQLATSQLRPVRKLLRGIGTLLQGEDAVYVRNPPPGSKLPEITLVADLGPGVDGLATLDRILGDKSLNLRKAPQGTVIAGIPAARLDFGQFEIDYANVAQKLIVTDGPGGIRALASPSSRLADDPDFTDATDGSGLPSRIQGFLYVNVTGGLALGQRLAGAPIPASIKRNLKPLRSAIEYGVTRPSELQVTFFVRIK
jgi:hypothetical protein